MAKRFDGQEYRRVGLDRMRRDDFKPFSTGLLNGLRNQSCFIDRNRGASCSVPFMGKGYGLSDYVNVRPLVTAGRWASFLMIPWVVEPGESEIQIKIFYRTSTAFIDAEGGNGSESQVQVRPYLIANSERIVSASLFSLDVPPNMQGWSAERVTVAVDSSGLIGPARDVLVLDMYSDPEQGQQIQFTGGSIDELNGEFVDLSGFVPDMFFIDDPALSPEPGSPWVSVFRVRDSITESDFTEFHSLVWSSTNKTGAVYPFINTPTNNVIVDLLSVPYLQVRNVDISKKFDKQISIVNQTFLNSEREASAQGIGAIAANANELIRRHDLCCARLETMYSDNLNSVKKDNFYGERNYWTSPYVRSDSERTFVAGGKTNIESPRFIARALVIPSHSRTNILKTSNSSQDGGSGGVEALERYTIDGAINWKIEILQGGVVIAEQETTNQVLKYWPASNDDSSPFLLQTYHAENETIHRTGNTYRSGLVYVDQGSGPDAPFIQEISQEFILDNPAFDRRCSFEVRVTMLQNAGDNEYPRWSDESAFPQGQYVNVSGPHNVAAQISAVPPAIPFDIGFREYPENPATVRIVGGDFVADGVQPGDRIVIRSAPDPDVNGTGTVVQVLGAADLEWLPDRQGTWDDLPVAGTVEIQRSALILDELRVDVVGFSLWATGA